MICYIQTFADHNKHLTSATHPTHAVTLVLFPPFSGLENALVDRKALYALRAPSFFSGLSAFRQGQKLNEIGFVTWMITIHLDMRCTRSQRAVVFQGTFPSQWASSGWSKRGPLAINRSLPDHFLSPNTRDYIETRKRKDLLKSWTEILVHTGIDDWV